ncbi:MAG: hypothetical protein JW798_07000 [Prolixibacteraceae bacterium]|nr:hypothetical protein [Prolixibacteraceae bacterium]
MKNIFLIIFLITAIQSFSRTDTIIVKNINYKSIVANYHYGYISPTCDFIKGDNLLGKPLEYYRSLSIKMVWQNPGYSNWQRVFHAPYYGVGLTIGDFYNPGEVGYPLSLYGLFSIPLKRWEKLELYTEIQYGLTGNWKHYDPITNPKNLVIAGDFTFHAQVGLNAFYPLTKKPSKQESK